MPVVNMSDIVIKEEDTRLIQGYASVEVLDRQSDMVPIDTMQKAMLKYMERGGLLLYGHENKPIGRVLNWVVKEEPRYGVPAVEIIGVINKGYKLDDEVWELIKDNKLTGFSIGGSATDIGFAKMDDGTEARLLKGIELSEISIVAEPANQGAVITGISMAKSYTKDFTDMSEDELGKAAQDIVKDVLFDMQKDKKHKSYPWSQCIADQKRSGHSAESAKKICGYIKAKFGKMVGMVDTDEDYIMHEFILEKARGGANDIYAPTKEFMDACVLKAMDIEGNPKGARSLCAYIYRYYFNSNQREADDWAYNLLSGEHPTQITEEMITAHNAHDYFKYRDKEKYIRSAIADGMFPPEDWFLKAVANYEGAESPYMAAIYLSTEPMAREFDKGNGEFKVPVIDGVLAEVRTLYPSLYKAMGDMEVVMKRLVGAKEKKSDHEGRFDEYDDDRNVGNAFGGDDANMHQKT